MTRSNYIYFGSFIWVITLCTMTLSCGSKYHMDKAKKHLEKAIKKDPTILYNTPPDTVVKIDTLINDSIITILKTVEITPKCPEIPSEVLEVKTRRDKRREYKLDRMDAVLRKRIHDDSVKIEILKLRIKKIEARKNGNIGIQVAKAQKREAGRSKCNWVLLVLGVAFGFIISDWFKRQARKFRLFKYYNTKKDGEE